MSHLIDVELRLAPGHFSVAGAELAYEVMPVTQTQNHISLHNKLMFLTNKSSDSR